MFKWVFRLLLIAVFVKIIFVFGIYPALRIDKYSIESSNIIIEYEGFGIEEETLSRDNKNKLYAKFDIIKEF